MLLDLEIKIIVTNDGKDNTIEVKTKQDNKILHVATALEMAMSARTDLITQFLAKKGIKFTQEEADEFIRTATIKDLILD